MTLPARSLDTMLAGRYDLKQMLGQGGMGQVHLAFDRLADRLVALKVLIPTLTQDETARRALCQEFLIAKRLAHPRTVEVHDFGTTDDGRPYFTMEVVAGPGLDERIPLPPHEAIPLLRDALQALALLQARSLVHGDLSPQNLRLDQQGRLKLMDLGLVRPQGEGPGTVQGTPLYLSPEAARGERLDHRSDLYSLGAVFYHLLAGSPPFPETEPLALLRAHTDTLPQPLNERCPAVPKALATLLMRMLAKSPSERPASATEALGLLDGDHPLSLLPPDLIGREAESATLMRALDEPPSGALKLAGPAGSGKSRLLAAVASLAQLSGRDVLLLRTGGPEALPYATLAPLRRHLELLAHHRAPQALTAALRLLDEEPPGQDPRSRWLRLQAGWMALLEASKGERPLVLLLDDWHLADEASRELVESLSACGTAHVVTVDPLAPMAEIVLGPLDLRGIETLAAQRLGLSSLSPLFIQDLHRLSEGSPLRALGLIDALHRRDGIPREGTRWRTDRIALTVEDLPQDLAELALARLEPLSPNARFLVEGLAAARRAQALTLLGRWIGLEPAALTTASAELEACGLLLRDGEAHRLADPQVASALSRSLDAEKWRRLHQALCAGIEKTPDTPARTLDLVHHLTACERHEEAAHHAVRGARFLLDAYALNESARLLETALGQPNLDLTDRSQALEVLGDLRRMRGEHEAAIAPYEEALALRPSGRTSRLRINLALVHQMLSRFEAGLALAEQGANEAAQAVDLLEEARALTTLARLHHLMGEVGPARDAAERGLTAARRAGAQGFEAEALGLLGYFKLGEPAELAEALTLLDASLQLREALGDRLGLNDAYMLRGNAQMALGRYEEARASFRHNLALCREIGAAHSDEITALLNLGQVALELGDREDAERALDEALEMAHTSGDRFLQGYGRALRARLLTQRGQLAEAEAEAQGALAAADELESKYLAIVAHASLAPLHLALGDPLGALEAAERGLALSRENGINEFEAPLLLEAGAACLALGAPERAGPHVLAALHRAEELRSQGAIARVTLASAQIALAQGDLASAAQHLEAARLLATQAGMADVLLAATSSEATLMTAQDQVWEAALRYRQLHAEASRRDLVLLAIDAALRLGELAPGDEAQRLIAQAETARTRIIETLAHARRAAFARRYRSANTAQAPSLEAGMASVIADFGRMVTGSLQPQEVLTRVIDQVMAITEAARGMIMLVDAHGALSGLVTRPRSEAEDGGLMSFSRSFVDAALRERRSVWVADAQTDARFAAARSVLALDLRTVICVPLIVEDAVIGLLYLDRQSVNRTFDEADLRLVEGLAGFAALAIANATRFEETQERNKLLATAQALASLCSPRVTPEQLRREIAWQGLVLADAETAALYDEAAEPLVCLDARGTAITCQPPLEALANARLTGVVSTTSNVQLTTLILPLMANHRCWGILCLSRPATRLFTPQEIATLEGIGAQMAHLLEAQISREAQAQRIERLEKAMRQLDDRHDASKLDPQSGLFSAPYVIQRLRDEVTEALRYDQPLSLLVLEAARIEALAAHFGPQTGDDMWRHLGDALAQMSRKTDVAARLEGEHCAILMPQTPLAGAEVFARRLKEHLDEFAICDANGAELWKLDVAVATIQWQVAETPDEMLARALGALPSEG